MESERPKTWMLTGLGESFMAVLLGNVVYFALSPYLPNGFQHELFRPDVGLFIDFLFCAAAFWLIRAVRPWLTRVYK